MLWLLPSCRSSVSVPSSSRFFRSLLLTLLCTPWRLKEILSCSGHLHLFLLSLYQLPLYCEGFLPMISLRVFFVPPCYVSASFLVFPCRSIMLVCLTSQFFPGLYRASGERGAWYLLDGSLAAGYLVFFPSRLVCSYNGTAPKCTWALLCVSWQYSVQCCADHCWGFIYIFVVSALGICSTWICGCIALCTAHRERLYGIFSRAFPSYASENGTCFAAFYSSATEAIRH